MKIQRIQYPIYVPIKPASSLTCEKREASPAVNTLSHAYFPNICFTSYISDCPELKGLLQYNIPCIYSGVPLLDSSKIAGIQKTLNKDSQTALEALQPYEKYMQPTERNIFTLLKTQSKEYPEKTIQDILIDIAKNHEAQLRTEQERVIDTLKDMSKGLPEESQYKFQLLLHETYDKLDKKPVVIPFSRDVFLYNLEKLCDYNFITPKIRRKMLQQGEKIPANNGIETQVMQLHRVNSIERMATRTSLNNLPEFKELIQKAKEQIGKKPIVMHFSRKTFIHDLKKVLNGMPEVYDDLYNEMMATALEIPSSQTSISAFAAKNSRLSSSIIATKLVIPSVASIEHVKPRSKDGKNNISNYALASKSANEKRGDMPLYEFFKNNPQVKLNIQKHFDRLIELANDGTFEKCEVPHMYIWTLKNRIEKESRETKESEPTINIDISALQKWS